MLGGGGEGGISSMEVIILLDQSWEFMALY